MARTSSAEEGPRAGDLSETPTLLLIEVKCGDSTIDREEMN